MTSFYAARVKKASLLACLDIKILIIENGNQWGCWEMPIWCIREGEEENFALGHIQKHCLSLATLFKTS